MCDSEPPHVNSSVSFKIVLLWLFGSNNFAKYAQQVKQRKDVDVGCARKLPYSI